MTQPEPLWLLFGETAQISLRRMSDGVTVYFEVIATGEAGSVLVMGGNAHISSCEISVDPDGACYLGLGLCTVPIVNDGSTVQMVAAHLGIRAPAFNASYVAPQQRLLA
ncbi:MAG TPA: hypothetical protein VLC71_08235 [Thermomonas sp.]|nr:hypothetical protein [Thermomonas sp.]